MSRLHADRPNTTDSPDFTILYAQDLDGDGEFDTFGLDTTGDGIADVRVRDTDGDEEANFSSYSTDGDASYDIRVFDTDGDGNPDSVSYSPDAAQPTESQTAAAQTPMEKLRDQAHEDGYVPGKTEQFSQLDNSDATDTGTDNDTDLTDLTDLADLADEMAGMVGQPVPGGSLRVFSDDRDDPSLPGSTDATTDGEEIFEMPEYEPADDDADWFPEEDEEAGCVT